MLEGLNFIIVIAGGTFVFFSVSNSVKVILLFGYQILWFLKSVFVHFEFIGFISRLGLLCFLCKKYLFMSDLNCVLTKSQKKH